MKDSVKAASCHRNTRDELFSRIGDVNDINKFIADITTGPVYNKQEVMDKLVVGNPAEASKLHHMEDFEVQRLLVAIKKTSSGDKQNSSILVIYELAIVTYIINLSISCGRPPNNWSNAIITPVPKVTSSKCLTDLRPISVTPILSTLCECYVVKQYLLPAIRRDDIDYQFAFRPTGSTTAARIYILHHVTLLLKKNDYVRCLLADFSKAFDIVNHVYTY